MARYPDKFVIMKPMGEINDPYNAPEYAPVYTGACRCFLRKTTALRNGSVKDSDFRIVVPNRRMPEIGENYRACVKMHTSTDARYWDLVGYVTDFARYDRVCNIDFQMIKENVIYEDIPEPKIDAEDRQLTTLKDSNGMVLEGVSVMNGNLVVDSQELLSVYTTEQDKGKIIHLFQRYEEFGERWVSGIDWGYKWRDQIGDWKDGFFGVVPMYNRQDIQIGTVQENNTYYLCQYEDEPEWKNEDGILYTEDEPNCFMKFEVVEN